MEKVRGKVFIAFYMNLGGREDKFIVAVISYAN